MQGTAEAAADPGEMPEQYVINLCASTTPMALEQPKSEALKRFTFFISRRREDGRERFRLHMGYFSSPDEAQEWLTVVRELYPAAWVGEAPGKKLRAAARAAASCALTAAEPAAAPTPAPVVVPVVAPVVVPVTAPVTPPVAVTLAIAATVVDAPAANIPPAMAALSNVREVLAQLDRPDSASNAPAHTLYVPPPPVLPEHIPTVQALTPAPMVPEAPRMPAAPNALAAAQVPVVHRAQPTTPKPLPAPGPPVVKSAPPPAVPLTDTQVLRVLEERRSEGANRVVTTPDERAASSAIELLRPDDTRTMRALREEVQRNAPAQFAVQLAWSVTPIDVTAVPPLAIFSAYTLYTVESSREGRRWYGLRLGFFSDALSAKQVAYYVRSDFSAVAVVPVTSVEKDKAAADMLRQPAVVHKREAGKAADEFKLFDMDQPPTKPVPTAASVHAKLAQAAKPGKRSAAGARAKPAPRGKARTLEESLEQTLEILGASDLEIDRGRGELLNDSGVRHLSVKVDKRTSTFAKLLDRLSDRVGKG
ncbi:MAG TPA: hypothetical protein PLK05_09680 [Steroidobacteraceae bacterium]|nr:hypothetical protein [Steroidobacteraceae bacterium]